MKPLEAIGALLVFIGILLIGHVILPTYGGGILFYCIAGIVTTLLTKKSLEE